MSNKELNSELKLLKEKVSAFVNQFEICCELLLSKVQDIERCQDYIISKIHRKDKAHDN
jgi:predicted phage-related endonuclease